MPRRNFYFEYKDAVRLRDQTTNALKGKSWKPYDTEVVEVKILPNEKKTYRLELCFKDGEIATLHEFLEANKLNMAFLETISN